MNTSSQLISVQDIVADPVQSYLLLAKRLEVGGMNAPFPEFRPVVEHLLAALSDSDRQETLRSHPDLAHEYTEVKTMCAHVNMEFIFDDENAYPYPKPFSAPFPYRPTIDAIEATVRLLDKLDRIGGKNKAVPFYHFDRYAYHRHALIADQNIVLYPTIETLTFYDLIRTRAVPIGFIGVVAETTRVDRHYQSPLDFWYHDLNHVRRMWGYICDRAKHAGLVTAMQMGDFYRRMDNFILEKIVPNIIKLPKGATPEEVAIRRLVRVLFFEVVHESALTAERDVIVGELLREPGPQPFEHMLEASIDVVPDDIEQLRTPVGNIQSGASLASERKGASSTITVRYFWDRALALLANVYNKINFGFYDDPDNPSSFVVPPAFRKPEHVLAAAKEVFRILEVTDYPSDDELLSMISSTEGSEERFVYKSVDAAASGRSGQTATEPITAREIIEQVGTLGKRVHTFMGYSVLDYEHKDDVLGQIHAELETLDPATTIISIGATEEGIGAAYEIAREMGFQTIGWVSTQALFYSGRFSPFVQNIYIVNDKNWGGYIPGTKTLAPATEVFLQASDHISAYGGGYNTAAVLEHALERGIPTTFTPAEMNHAKALEQAGINGTTTDIDFRGAAHAVWEKKVK